MDAPVFYFHSRGRKGKRQVFSVYSPLRPFPVKRQFRNARRRFETANKKILSAEYAQSNA